MFSMKTAWLEKLIVASLFVGTLVHWSYGSPEDLKIDSKTHVLLDPTDISNLPMTGVPTAPTASGATNTTQVATTAFVHAVAGAGDVTGPGSSTNGHFAQFNGTTGKILEDGGLSLTVDGTLAANSDSLVPSEKAVKTYVDVAVAGVSFSGAANLVLATPNGSSGAATLRSLVLADLPSISESKITLSDVTTDNVSAAAHGFVAKLPDDPTLFYNGVGSYVAIPATGGTTGSQIISGGGVACELNDCSTLGFIVSAATYTINGTQYTSAQTTLTLGTADPSFDRIDVIALDDTGSAVVVPGTAAASPQQPTVDPASQVFDTFIYVPAGATAPSFTTENVYLENTEWTSSTNSSGTINLASTSNPFAGTKDIEGTAAANGNQFTLVRPGGSEDLSGFTSLVFQIRSKAAWPNQKALSIFWQNGTTSVGTSIALKTGVLGFNSSVTGGYQQIVIPIANFGTGSNHADRVRFAVSGGGANIGFYVDNVVLMGNSGGGGSGGGGGTGSGDFSTNTSTSVVGELVEFADTTGKLGKRSTGTGIVKFTSGVQGIGAEGADYLGPARIDDTAYNATSWDADATHAPSKNAVRDKFESLAGTIPTISDTAFGSSWNGVTTIAPSKNAVYDELHLFDTDDNGKVNVLDQVAGITNTNSSGVIQTPITDNSSNWNTAFTQSERWNGGATDLVAATGRTSLGLVIGTDVQPHDTDLDTLAGLTATTDNFIISVAGAWASRTPSQARTTLGLVIGANVEAWSAALDTWATTTNNATNWDTAYTERHQWDGGATNLVAATGRASLGGTTVGQALFTLTNPSAISWPRINADNSVTARSAANTLTDLGGTTVGINLLEATNPSAITFPKIAADNSVSFRTPSQVASDIGAITALTHTVTFVVDGSGAVISSGTKSYVKIPYGGTLQGWTLIGSPSGSITCDIYRAADGAGLPTLSIVGGSGTKPALSSAVENSSTSFTSYTSTTLTALDNLAINVSGVTNTTYVCLTLYYQ
jgi:hypothetical protein